MDCRGMGCFGQGVTGTDEGATAPSSGSNVARRRATNPGGGIGSLGEGAIQVDRAADPSWNPEISMPSRSHAPHSGRRAAFAALTLSLALGGCASLIGLEEAVEDGGAGGGTGSSTGTATSTSTGTGTSGTTTGGDGGASASSSAEVGTTVTGTGGGAPLPEGFTPTPGFAGTHIAQGKEGGAFIAGVRDLDGPEGECALDAPHDVTIAEFDPGGGCTPLLGLAGEADVKSLTSDPEQAGPNTSIAVGGVYGGSVTIKGDVLPEQSVVQGSRGVFSFIVGSDQSGYNSHAISAGDSASPFTIFALVPPNGVGWVMGGSFRESSGVNCDAAAAGSDTDVASFATQIQDDCNPSALTFRSSPDFAVLDARSEGANAYYFADASGLHLARVPLGSWIGDVDVEEFDVAELASDEVAPEAHRLHIIHGDSADYFVMTGVALAGFCGLDTVEAPAPFVTVAKTDGVLDLVCARAFRPGGDPGVAPVAGLGDALHVSVAVAGNDGWQLVTANTDSDATPNTLVSVRLCEHCEIRAAQMIGGEAWIVGTAFGDDSIIFGEAIPEGPFVFHRPYNQLPGVVN